MKIKKYLGSKLLDQRGRQHKYGTQVLKSWGKSQNLKKEEKEKTGRVHKRCAARATAHRGNATNWQIEETQRQSQTTASVKWDTTHKVKTFQMKWEITNRKLRQQWGETKEKYKPDTDARKVLDVAQLLLPPDSESFDSSHIGGGRLRACVGEQLFVGLEIAESQIVSGKNKRCPTISTDEKSPTELRNGPQSVVELIVIRPEEWRALIWACPRSRKSQCKCLNQCQIHFGLIRSRLVAVWRDD